MSCSKIVYFLKESYEKRQLIQGGIKKNRRSFRRFRCYPYNISVS